MVIVKSALSVYKQTEVNEKALEIVTVKQQATVWEHWTAEME